MLEYRLGEKRFGNAVLPGKDSPGFSHPRSHRLHRQRLQPAPPTHRPGRTRYVTQLSPATLTPSRQSDAAPPHGPRSSPGPRPSFQALPGKRGLDLNGCASSRRCPLGQKPYACTLARTPECPTRDVTGHCWQSTGLWVTRRGVQPPAQRGAHAGHRTTASATPPCMCSEAQSESNPPKWPAYDCDPAYASNIGD